jgi:hypothetical protein
VAVPFLFETEPCNKGYKLRKTKAGRSRVRPRFIEPLEPRRLLSSAVLVKDINATNESSDPTQITNVNGQVFFVAETSLYAWNSSTNSATPLQGLSGTSTMMAPMGSELFFSTFDVNTGAEELWKTDGTQPNTMEVPLPKNLAFVPHSLIDPTVMGNKLYFFTDDASGENQQFCVTDGTTTSLVTDIVASNGSRILNNLVNLNGEL